MCMTAHVVTRWVTARDVRRVIMRRFGVLLSLIVIVLFGSLALHPPPVVIAQEATPGAEEFMPEGVSFEPLAGATELALPSTGELFLARVTIEPGAGFPIDPGDPSYALVFIERGELTIRVDGPLTVTRAGALSAAMGEEEAGGTFAPEMETIPADQDVTIGVGDSVLFPPNQSGEVRNDGQEPVVALGAIVGPPPVEATPTAGTPTS